MNAFLAISVVVVYFILLIFMVTKYGKAKDGGIDEFAVAGRTFPWYMILFTILGSWMVGSVFIADFGWAAMEGAIAYYGAIYGLTGLIFFYYIAPRAWLWGKVHTLYNMPDCVGLRFNNKKLVFIIALAAGFIISWPWQVMALMTFGYTINVITYGIVPIQVAVGIFAIVIAFYCIYGGMRSVVVTDFIQGLVCCVVVMFGVIAVMYIKFDGIGPMFKKVMAVNPDFLTVVDTKYMVSIIISGTLGAYCFPEIFNRIFLARSVRDVKITVRLSPIIMFVSIFLVISLGIGGSLMSSITESVEAAESGFLTIFADAGGPFLLAFAAIVIIAAEMSSIDSQMTVMGTIFAINIVEPFKKGGLSDIAKVKVSRWFIALWTLAMFFITFCDLPMLITYAIVTYEFLSILFPTIILSILWRRGNASAAFASMIVGWSVCGSMQIWPQVMDLAGGWGAGFTGAVSSIIVYVIIAFLTPVEERVNKLFDEVEAFNEEHGFKSEKASSV
ncbi:MAG: sodium:solute symporter family protein [Desulfobacterales bacterium]|nr:sodium:solute symporter family protein [Desulfobacterales bacterium]